MTLIKCPECKKQISSHAYQCPQCGFPINDRENLGELKNHNEEIKPQLFTTCAKCGAAFNTKEGKMIKMKVGKTRGVGGISVVYGKELVCPKCAGWHDFLVGIRNFILLAIAVVIGLMILSSHRR